MQWNFWKQCASLIKSLPKHYFTSLLKDLSNEDLVTLCELLAIEIAKLKRRLYATRGKWAWVLQDDKNKVLQVLVNRWMIRPPSKSRELWDNWKRQRPNP